MVSLVYDNRKTFCPSYVTLALSYDNRKTVVRYVVNRAPGVHNDRQVWFRLTCDTFILSNGKLGVLMWFHT